MASTSPKPKKSILKSSNSIDHRKKRTDTKPQQQLSKKGLEWDEMNILATHHPPDKDYGFMKVDEPPTPYNKAAISDGEDEGGSERKGSLDSGSGVDADDLAARLKSDVDDSRKRFADDDDDDDEDSEDDSNLTEEERARRKSFMSKRKMHYNEFQAVQLAKKLMAQDEEEEDEAADGGGPCTSTSCDPKSKPSPNRSGNNKEEEEEDIDDDEITDKPPPPSAPDQGGEAN